MGFSSFGWVIFLSHAHAWLRPWCFLSLSWPTHGQGAVQMLSSGCEMAINQLLPNAFKITYAYRSNSF